MENKLIEFIKGEFALDDGIKITPNTKLISSGIIDSFSMVSLQLYIKKEFGKNIPNPKMTMENCDTIDKLILLINGYWKMKNSIGYFIPLSPDKRKFNWFWLPV